MIEKKKKNFKIPNKVKCNTTCYMHDRPKTNILKGLKVKNKQCCTSQMWITRKQIEFRPKNFARGTKKRTICKVISNIQNVDIAYINVSNPAFLLTQANINLWENRNKNKSKYWFFRHIFLKRSLLKNR